ncbi:class I fructose-bisphosphate aldolase [Enterococcus sp. UD-01]|jgi:class I fructose-bisphosphate aldolase|uniref:class I fructose-bisphosphate aldolase n=1 Tax=Enterococcus sp. UD-01 TaxID=3373911 RepID=UPI003834BBA2
MVVKNTNQVGKELRISRFLNPESQRCVMVAYAHGILLGPIKGMTTNEEIKAQTKTLRAADAILMPMGFLPACQELFTGKDAPEMIALYDWQSVSRPKNHVGYVEGAVEPVTSIERVLASGATGVMTYLFIGQDDPEIEAKEMRRNYEVNELCQKYGLIHIIEPRVIKSKETNPDGTMKFDLMKVHTRMAAELGADFIKVKYPDTPEQLKELQDISPAPLMVAGGSKIADSDADAMAQASVTAGTAGIVFGRNIYQADDPRAALERFKKIVHKN